MWLNSVITNHRLPYHFAERGTVDPNIRFCLKVRDLQQTHSLLSENGFRLSDIYNGPDGNEYFDFWSFGMKLHSVHEEEGYAFMQLGVNHMPDEVAACVLEKLPKGAYTGKVDGTVRPLHIIHDRDEFLAYHRYLKESGVDTGEIGGFTGGGRIAFHFYDPDGNRFNILYCK